MSHYADLIEAALTFGGVSLFVWWQMRELKRDVAAREARERETLGNTDNSNPSS
jgi:hypothetical protein